MKRVILILSLVLAAVAAPSARAETTYTIVLAGGAAQNTIHIWLSADGRSYVIDSVVPLEVGGTVCENPPGVPTELVCKAPQVAGFEINGGEGDDTVVVSSAIDLPVTMRGGPGRDRLIGGSGPDKLIGGDGNDKLAGRGGDDVLFGGEGNDELLGGSGNDVLNGGGGRNVLNGGSGENVVRPPQS
jgi:Ca2+-binding RTX toxin-like protein